MRSPSDWEDQTGKALSILEPEVIIGEPTMSLLQAAHLQISFELGQIVERNLSGFQQCLKFTWKSVRLPYTEKLGRHLHVVI